MNEFELSALGQPLAAGDPRQLEGWTLHRRLGVGGMGVVYLATRDSETGALKVIAPHLADDPAFKTRFKRELSLCRRVSGSNVARLIDGDADAATPWLTMEFFNGPTLHRRVSDHGPLPAEQLRSLATGAAQALQQIHAAGVVHRDLKPSNVILTPDGPVVIDFGVATAAEATTLTATGLAIGSAGWMAPEQIRGEEVGEPADVFSWAATVAFAATGRPPFGIGRPEALSYRVVHTPPDVDGVPAELLAILLASFHQQPQERPLLSAIRAALSGDSGAVPTLASEPPASHEQTTELSPTVAAFTAVSSKPGSARRSASRSASISASRSATGPVVVVQRAPRSISRNSYTLILLLIGLAAWGAFALGTWSRNRTVFEQGVAATESTVDAATESSATVASDNQVAPTTAVPDTASPASTASTASATSNISIPVPSSEESTNIVLPSGVEPPQLPVQVDGNAPVGPVQRTSLRFYGGSTVIYSEDFGNDGYACTTGFWTARWRTSSPDSELMVELVSSLFVNENYVVSSDAPVGGAGYLSGSKCEKPVFVRLPDDPGVFLFDVILEWQEWQRAV